MKIKKYTIFLFFIFLIATSYALSHTLGLYGYSNDWYAEYYKNNYNVYQWRDWLGFRIATFTIFGQHLGIQITSFFVAYSTGILLRAFFIYNKQNSIILFLLIYLILLHVHPIIMSNTGAMRQGLAMSLVFFSISLILKNKKRLPFFLFLFSIFIHKSGYLFFLIYLATLLIEFINKKFKNLKLVYFLIISLLIYFFILTFHNLNINNRIIGYDMRYAWIVVNFLYIFLFLFFLTKKSPSNMSYVFTFLFLHAIVSLAAVSIGLTWQYERINMMIALPLFLSISSIFEKTSSYIYLFMISSLYLFFTIYLGMYTRGLT